MTKSVNITNYWLENDLNHDRVKHYKALKYYRQGFSSKLFFPIDSGLDLML